MRICNQKTHIENWYADFVANMLQSWIFGQDTKFITKKKSMYQQKNWWQNFYKTKLTKFKKNKIYYYKNVLLCVQT